ncbi:MAG: tetratricopeptide repeat protein [Candidatus Methylomirabilia bacterium]
MANLTPRSSVAEDSEAASIISRYQERLANDPTSLAFAPLADAYRKAGRTQEAIALCKDGLSRYPDYATARVILAKAYLAEGNQQGALDELHAVVTLTPDDAQTHRLLAEVHIKRGELEHAQGHLEQVLRLHPTDRDARVMLELLTGRKEAGEGSAILKLLEDNTFVTVTFASLCLEQGLPEEAATIFLRILKKDPVNERARDGLGEALAAKARRGRA